MKDRLAIFDLDGTLYDTFPVNYRAYELALRQQGIELEETFFRTKCNGKYYKQFLPMVRPDMTNEMMEKVHDAKLELYETCLDRAVPNENLVEFARAARHSFHVALVTTASRKNTEQILRHFGHYDLFDLIITQNDVMHKKPDPEGYLKAMEHFHIPPSRTVIFEDSDICVETALACGASAYKVLGVEGKKEQ